MNQIADALPRRMRRLEAQIGSISSESDKAVQNLERAVADLNKRVTDLESQADSLRR